MTSVKCADCEATVIEAKDHVAGEDDGNCTTEDKCIYCGEIIGDVKTDHVDKDGDFICDNKDCAVTLPGAPVDDNEGIDLPIDRN